MATRNTTRQSRQSQQSRPKTASRSGRQTSVSRTPRTATKRRTQSKRKPAKKRVVIARKYKAIATLIAFLLASYTVYSMISLQAELSQAKALLEEKKATIEQQTLENKQLLDLLENGDEKALIERVAREKLGYAYAGEEIFENISGN